jgi:hypothetical protein
MGGGGLSALADAVHQAARAHGAGPG